jgi:hypothetical protein
LELELAEEVATAATAAAAVAESNAIAAAAASAHSGPETAAVMSSADAAVLERSTSSDDLCQVDELDTPEALTDVDYSPQSPPGSPTDRRRYLQPYTPGTWQVGGSSCPQPPQLPHDGCCCQRGRVLCMSVVCCVCVCCV